MKPWHLALWVGALYVLHQDFWNWDRSEPFIFGFLPIGLAYHAMYSVMASVMMWILVRYAWPAELDEEERRSTEVNSSKQGPKA